MINNFWKVKNLLNSAGRVKGIKANANENPAILLEYVLAGKEQELKEILGISGAAKAEPKKETAPKKAEKPVEKVAEEKVENPVETVAEETVSVETKSEEAPVAKKKGKKNAE